MLNSLRSKFRRKNNTSLARRTLDQPGMASFTAAPGITPPPAYTSRPNNSFGTHDIALADSASDPLSFVSFAHSPSLPEREDPYAFLSMFDTIILIDDSASMADRSWHETRQALSHLLPVILGHDKDGIDLYFLNHTSSDVGNAKEGIAAGGYRNIVSVDAVERIFNIVTPRYGTPTGTRCRDILKPYIGKLEVEAKNCRLDGVKPLNIIVITDGVPSDDVESVLLEAAKKLDALSAAPHQVGVQFFQVGNEVGAADALKELDDGLVELTQGGVRDIVDTCTWMAGIDGDGLEGRRELSASGILKIVLGAVVKKLDRQMCSSKV